MYSAPDFVKISVQQTTAFASACDPEWHMSEASFVPTCKKITMGSAEELPWECYIYLNAPN